MTIERILELGPELKAIITAAKTGKMTMAAAVQKLMAPPFNFTGRLEAMRLINPGKPTP